MYVTYMYMYVIKESYVFLGARPVNGCDIKEHELRPTGTKWLIFLETSMNKDIANSIQDSLISVENK